MIISSDQHLVSGTPGYLTQLLSGHWGSMHAHIADEGGQKPHAAKIKNALTIHHEPVRRCATSRRISVNHKIIINC